MLKIFLLFFFMWHLNSFTPGFLLLCGNWVKTWPTGVPGQPRCHLKSGFYQIIVNILSKFDCFYRIPEQSETHSLSRLSQWTHATKGGTSKDNNNHEVGCDLIFNAKPRQHYYTN